MWKCPNCHTEIEYLDYRQPQIEYGTVDLNIIETAIGNHRLGDHNSNDCSSDDYATYLCPECDEELTPSSLIWEAPPVETPSITQSFIISGNEEPS